MSNHLEDLLAEWLEFNGYFVRKSVLVGKRSNGGFEGELDVVGVHPVSRHLLHVECSLDTDSWEVRETRFFKKFERGRRFVPNLFQGLELDPRLDQVALLQYGGGNRTELGGGRVAWVTDLVADMIAVFEAMSPDKQAVPSTLPLLRTMQLAAQPAKRRKLPSRLTPAKMMLTG